MYWILDFILFFIGFIVFIVLWVILSKICDRYFGFTLMFNTNYRALAENRSKNFQIEWRVKSFSVENKVIYNYVINELKRKHIVINYRNIEDGILKYIKNNPNWAEDDYQIQLLKYRKTMQVNYELSLVQTSKNREEIETSLRNKGFNSLDIKKIMDENKELYTVEPFRPLEPQKKKY